MLAGKALNIDYLWFIPWIAKVDEAEIFTKE
jgi:hypothetical protein